MNMQQEQKETADSAFDFDSLLHFLPEHGTFRWNECSFILNKHQHAVLPVQFEVEAAYTRILIAAPTVKQAAEGVSYLLQLPHSSNDRMNIRRYRDWSKQETTDDDDGNLWCSAFSTEQLQTILTSSHQRTVGFHHFIFSAEQSIVIACHGGKIVLHCCSFIDGGHAFLRETELNGTSVLQTLTLNQMPWEPMVWKRLLPLLQVNEMTLENITIDAEDSDFLSKVPSQLSLLRCNFTDQAERLCQLFAQTGGPDTVVLEDEANTQAQPWWRKLLSCAVQDCENVKTLGIHIPSTWNATNHLPLAVQTMRGNKRIKRLILRNAQHPQQWSEALQMLSLQTSLQRLNLMDCCKDNADQLIKHIIDVLTHNRNFQIQLQGKGEYWHRIQREKIEPQLLYNRLHCFAEKCQQISDQCHRMTLLSSALAETIGYQAPALSHLLLTTNLDAFIACMQH
ncbi:hypothetical protein FisN_27Lh119 [Fistulifera solaris]|uniref:Uncharacterized protein n=1 Tax=Fistulifera solaris TaxID=1519565 RepID=A0A1Z5KAP5_FISSO|nr:hypothetical protein FisN_27Lh119 [Fistulifera solaris]|eukprot:GAX23343.1 hypothetical protein FisN_27Lh119 [Fistulifera solaris]